MLPNINNNAIINNHRDNNNINDINSDKEANVIIDSKSTFPHAEMEVVNTIDLYNSVKNNNKSQFASLFYCSDSRYTFNINYQADVSI